MLGGSLYIVSDLTRSIIITNSTFTLNWAQHNGGAIYCEGREATVITIDGGYSELNYAGGFAYLANYCRIRFINYYKITGNNATSGGAVYAYESALRFEEGDYFISYNKAEQFGGALVMDKSTLVIHIKLNNALLLFDENVVTSADGKGGAILCSG